MVISKKKYYLAIITTMWIFIFLMIKAFIAILSIDNIHDFGSIICTIIILVCALIVLCLATINPWIISREGIKKAVKNSNYIKLEKIANEAQKEFQNKTAKGEGAIEAITNYYSLTNLLLDNIGVANEYMPPEEENIINSMKIVYKNLIREMLPALQKDIEMSENDLECRSFIMSDMYILLHMMETDKEITEMPEGFSLPTLMIEKYIDYILSSLMNTDERKEKITNLKIYLNYCKKDHLDFYIRYYKDLMSEVEHIINEKEKKR